MIPLIIVFCILLIINVPIAFVVAGAGLAWFAFGSDGLSANIAIQRIVAQTQSYSFLAVPFFMFAGNLMNRTGITNHLIRFSHLITRRMIGATAQVSVVLSTMMGGISGSAVADAAMEARVLGPEMIKRGYTKGYSAGVICLTSLITCTIPPSLGLILYGFIGGVSIGKLFIAGIIPGILMMAALMFTVYRTAKKYGYDIPEPGIPAPTWTEIFHELKECIWALIFPIILIVGIRFGLFTPTEAGAFACVYAVLVGIFAYKELTWIKFVAALKDSFIDNGGIILIIALSGVFGYALTVEKTPVVLSGFLFSLTKNPTILMIIIILMLVVLGMFIDSNVNILLLTPIILPTLTQLNVDPVHFGVCMMTIVTMGCMTPPVGTALYTVCDILDCSVVDYVKESLPFFSIVIVLVVVMIFIPNVIMWLPNLVYGV